MGPCERNRLKDMDLSKANPPQKEVLNPPDSGDLGICFVVPPIIISHSQPVSANRAKCAENHHLDGQNGGYRLGKNDSRPLLLKLLQDILFDVNTAYKCCYKSAGDYGPDIVGIEEFFDDEGSYCERNQNGKNDLPDCRLGYNKT